MGNASAKSARASLLDSRSEGPDACYAIGNVARELAYCGSIPGSAAFSIAICRSRGFFMPKEGLR